MKELINHVIWKNFFLIFASSIALKEDWLFLKEKFWIEWFRTTSCRSPLKRLALHVRIWNVNFKRLTDFTISIRYSVYSLPILIRIVHFSLHFNLPIQTYTITCLILYLSTYWVWKSIDQISNRFVIVFACNSRCCIFDSLKRKEELKKTVTSYYNIDFMCLK